MLKYLLIFLLLMALTIQAEDSSIEVGVKTRFYHYTEKDELGDILDTEISLPFNVGGIYGAYEYKLDTFVKEGIKTVNSVQIQASYESGITNYTGSTLTSNGASDFGSVESTTFNIFQDYQVNLKQTYNTNHYILFGFGYKYWKRELSITQVEIYEYKYAQIALGTKIKINKSLHIGFESSAHLGINPTMQAIFDESQNINALNETFKLGTVYGIKLAVPLTIQIYKNLYLSTKVEYEFTSYARSDTIIVDNLIKSPLSAAAIAEPASKQKNWHLYSGLKYIF